MDRNYQGHRCAGRTLLGAVGACLVVSTLLGGCRRAAQPERPSPPTAARAQLLAETPEAGVPVGGQAGAPAEPMPSPAALTGITAPAEVTAVLVPPGVIPVPTSRPSQPVPEAGPPRRDPAVAALADQVTAGRLQAIASQLAAATAPSAGPVVPEVELLARRLESVWRGLEGSYGNQVLVELEEVPGIASAGHSVLATLPGIGRQKRLVYLTASLSVGERTGSGSASAIGEAAVLAEVARVLVQRRWDATIRLAAFAGGREAPGAAWHAQAAAGIGLPILAVVDLDLTAHSGSVVDARGMAIRVQVAEGQAGPSWQLARGLLALGPQYAGQANLAAVIEPAAGKGGLAFSQVGYPAVRLAAAALPGNDAGGAPGSLANGEGERLAAITRTIVGLVGHLALAPGAPENAPLIELAQDAPDRVRVRWDPVTDPSAAGYWVGWRRAEEPTYQGLVWVGRNTQWLVESQPADTEIAVAIAASDDQGHASSFGPEARWRFR